MFARTLSSSQNPFPLPFIHSAWTRPSKTTSSATSSRSLLTPLGIPSFLWALVALCPPCPVVSAFHPKLWAHWWVSTVSAWAPGLYSSPASFVLDTAPGVSPRWIGFVSLSHQPDPISVNGCIFTCASGQLAGVPQVLPCPHLPVSHHRKPPLLYIMCTRAFDPNFQGKQPFVLIF